MLGHEAQGKADRGQFDHSLIPVGNLAPIFRVLGIRSVCESFRVERPMGEVSAARGIGGQAPERAGKSLQIRRREIEMRRGRAKADAGSALREGRQERIEKVQQCLFHVLSGLEGIAGERIGVSKSIGHAEGSASLGFLVACTVAPSTSRTASSTFRGSAPGSALRRCMR